MILDWAMSPFGVSFGVMKYSKIRLWVVDHLGVYYKY